MRTSTKARKAGFRSGSEQRIAQQLDGMGMVYAYEPQKGKIGYTVPERQAKYLPDFILANGIIIEVKGVFSSKDRVKHLLIKKQRPRIDIRFIFDRPTQKLSKKSKTSYADWCDKNGFRWAKKTVPQAWIDEGKDELPW